MSIYFGNRLRILRAPEGDGGGGGGGGKVDPPDPAKEMETLKTSNATLLKEIEALKAAAKPPEKKKDDDPDLIAKAKAEQDRKDKTKGDTKTLESAIRFSMSVKDWAKTHATLLPKDVEGIFAESDKETYDSAIEKTSAIQSALVQTFFNQQANLDLLTPSQKSTIEDFLKLTKNGKQEKAATIYDSIFEPTFEMLKRVKKAEQLRSDGHSNQTDADKAYKDKMIKLSRKHYMGEKANA